MRPALTWLPLAVLLPLALGCGDDPDDPKGDDTAEGDTDTDTDADTDSDADTDTGKKIEDGDFTFRISGPLEELAFGLLPMDSSASSFEEMELGTVVTGETLQVLLPPPEAASLTVFDETQPDVLGRVWMASLFRDPDGDAELVPHSDHYTSLGEVVVVFLQDPVGGALENAGFKPGWNLRAFDPGEGIAYDVPLMASDIQLNQNLLRRPAQRFDGPYELDTDSSLVHLLVTAPEDLADGKVVSALDQPIEEKDGLWGLTLNASPPPSHQGLTKLDEDAAVEAVYAYLVGDAGVFESVDQILGLACYGDQPLLPVYVPSAVEPLTGLRYLDKHIDTGWSLYLGLGDGTMEPADPAIGLDASISDSCVSSE